MDDNPKAVESTGYSALLCHILAKLNNFALQEDKYFCVRGKKKITVYSMTSLRAVVKAPVQLAQQAARHTSINKKLIIAQNEVLIPDKLDSSSIIHYCLKG